MNATLGNALLSQSDFPSNFCCKNVTEHDLNTTVYASQIIAASGTGLFYLIMFCLGILGVCFEQCAKLPSSQGTLFFFLVGALITFVNVLTNADELQVKLTYRIFTISLIGIVFAVFGAVLFFTVPTGNGADAPTLGRQQPSMGLVVTSITLPLVAIEIVLLVASTAFRNTDESAGRPLTKTTWIYVLVDKSIFLAQKIIQVIIYLYLRNTITCQGYKENAQFYFRTLSFFNLIEWVDSQVNVNSDVRLSGIAKEVDGWFNAFTDLYTALIIDYRLLCSLLFLEHSVDVIETEHNNNNNEIEEADNIEGPTGRNLTPRERLIRNVGYVLGFSCLIAPVLCGLYYVHQFHLKPWVNVSAIIVNATIVVLGTCLLCSNDLDGGGKKESHGVKIMVCCMGAVGFTCWLIKAAIACVWAATANARRDMGGDPSYIGWDAPKFVARCVTTAFLMALFMQVNVRAFPLKNPNRTVNYLLVPALMLAIISVFLESLIDQYLGLDKIFRCEIKEESMKILFEAGPPMYLGFLIHVSLHFVIILTNIVKRDGDSPNSSYRSARSSTISEYLDAEIDPG